MMTSVERQRAIAMWGLALCVLASAAGWVFMRFGASWSIGDLPESDWMDHIVPAYIIAEVAFIPIGGKLTDNLGIRPTLILAPFLFVFGSMMCIISVSVEMLVAFRFVQGAGAGIMLALAFTAVGKFYFPHRRGKADELMTAAFAIGSLFGTGVGYYFTDVFNWRFGFVVFSLAMIVGFVVASKTLPEESHVRSKPDVVGLLLAAAAFGTAALYTQYVEVSFSLLSFESALIAAIIIALTALYFVRSRSSADSVMPIGTTRFQKTLILLMFMFSLCGLGLIQYFFKLYLTYYDFDIYKASTMFLFLIAGAAGPSIYGSRKVFDTGVRPWIIIGSSIVTIALMITHLIADQGTAQFSICLFLFGIGLGCLVNQIICSMQAVVPAESMGKHIGNLIAVRMLGIIAGNAIVGAYIKEVVRGNYHNYIIEINSGTNILQTLASRIMNDMKYVADALDDGFIMTVIIMAMAATFLTAIAVTLEKDDSDMISAVKADEAILLAESESSEEESQE